MNTRSSIIRYSLLRTDGELMSQIDTDHFNNKLLAYSFESITEKLVYFRGQSSTVHPLRFIHEQKKHNVKVKCIQRWHMC